MSKTVTITQAKNQLCDLVSRAAEGERITITNHGKPVAQLVHAGRPDRETIQAAFDRMRRRRQGRTLGDVTWKELRDVGRR